MHTRIDKLTPEQKAMMPIHAQEWIEKGLKTGETDWDTFDKYMPICYQKVGLKYPTKVIRVQSPLVGALAASLAEGIWAKKRKSGAVRNAVGGAVGGAVHNAVGDAVGDAVDGAVDGAVRDAVRDAVRNAVDGAVGDAVDDAVDGAVGDAVRDAVGDAVHGAVDGAVDGAVRDAVDGAVRNAVDGAVGDAVRDAVGDAVHGAVDGAVDGAVRDAVRDAVDDAVDGAVDGAVRDAVDGADLMTKSGIQFAIELKAKLNISMNWHFWLGGQFWVGYGWGWRGVAYVDFFLQKCGLELSKDMMERAEANRKVAESVNYIWANRDFIMVCARPKVINRNQQGALHNTRGMSIEYPDGYGLYHLNGVRFDQTLFNKVTSRKMSLSDVLNIVDIDQRKQAMRFVNVWDFIKEAKGIELNTHTKYGKDGRQIRYWLYEFPINADLFPKGAKYMVYDDSMVGAAEQHMQGVLMEHKTVAEAMAWKQSDDLFTLSPAEWELLELDVHFT